MQITYLGHAGFVVETDEAVVVVDPWLSPTGAFDSGWMQLPRNHHLAPLVREKLADRGRARFIYVSHEHRDHFDPELLASLPPEIPVIVPRFRRSALRRILVSLGFHDVRALVDGERVEIPGGYLRLFVSEVGLNRDSSLLVKAGGRSFLDLNDCKIHDRLACIRAEEGPIDVFAAQYSGAVWHPTCYDYEREHYEAVCRKKVASKFEAVVRGIRAVQPRAFLASAGPACFLDPILLEKNFEPVHIFPRAPAFVRWARERLGPSAPSLHELMPGDVLDVETDAVDELGTERVSDESFEAYVRSYSLAMRHLFPPRERNLLRAEVEVMFERLGAELARKLEQLTLRRSIARPLYVQLVEQPERNLRVDFQSGRVTVTDSIEDLEYAWLAVRTADVARVLDRYTTWEELLLSMRARLKRVPDVYEPVLHGFIAGEAEDLRAFCDDIAPPEEQDEQVEVNADERRYRVNRFCPHQGADLAEAWVEDGRYLVCPRHRWMFDLQNGGRCTANDSSIQAKALPRERDSERAPPEVAAEAGT